MIYDNELKRHKRTNFHHPKGLLTFPHIAAIKRKMSAFDRLMQQIRCLTMNIHGVSYIWEKDLRFTARLFWALVVIAAIVSCVFMYMTLSCQHSKKQIRTVVATSQMPIYKINFPAVALCPWIHVNWLRYEAAEKKFLPPNADNYSKQVFYDVVRILDDMELSQMSSLELIQNYTIPRTISKISIYDLTSFMAFRCDDLFLECFYDETKFDCCKIFVPERTEKGICMVFNSMISEESRKKQLNDKFYPWKNRKAGEGTGLKFTLRYNKTFAGSHSNNFFGLNVMIKECEEWSQSLVHLFLPFTKSSLSITPVISETLENIRRFDPRRRKCLFADEKSKHYHRVEGLRFNKLNCVIKCQKMKMLEVCNCSLSLFFPKLGPRECTVSDFKCIYENKDIFTYIKSPLQDEYINDSRRGVVCDCINSCYTLDFLSDLNANKLPDVNYSFPFIKGDIYMGQSVITKYETRLHSSAFDLIARFGGIMGLCLGASVLSLVEVFYAGIKAIAALILTKCSLKRKIKPHPKEEKH